MLCQQVEKRQPAAKGRIGLGVGMAAIGRLIGGSHCKFIISRQQLQGAQFEAALSKMIADCEPRHVWVSAGIGHWNLREKCQVAALCGTLFQEQISRGDHLHVHGLSAGSEVTESWVSEGWTDMLAGTRPLHIQGNSWYKQRHVPRTTSQVLHSWLDHRYITPNVPPGGRWDRTQRQLYQRYTAWQRVSQEKPLVLEEMCAAVEHLRDPETQTGFEQALKRRRYLLKQPPKEDDAYGKMKNTWTSIFQQLNTVAPRVGNHIVNPEDKILQGVQDLIPQMKLHHAVVCRGINRLRAPTNRRNPELATHRKTIVVHRQTGAVEEIPGVEHWSKLPKYKQARAGVPAKIALTVFGYVPEVAQVPSPSGSTDRVDTPNRTQTQASSEAKPPVVPSRSVELEGPK